MCYMVKIYDPNTGSWQYNEYDFLSLNDAVYQIDCMIECDIRNNDYFPGRYQIEISDTQGRYYDQEV